jgi:hypothetical protein
VAIEDAMMQGSPDASFISNTTDPRRSSTSGGGPALAAALQQAEETRTISPSAVSGSLQTPISSPALSSQFPAIESAVAHTDHVPRVPAASSSTSTTVPLSDSPRVTTISGPYPDAIEGTAGAQDDTQGTHPQSPPGGDTGL